MSVHVSILSFQTTIYYSRYLVSPLQRFFGLINLYSRVLPSVAAPSSHSQICWEVCLSLCRFCRRQNRPGRRVTSLPPCSERSSLLVSCLLFTRIGGVLQLTAAGGLGLAAPFLAKKPSPAKLASTPLLKESYSQPFSRFVLFRSLLEGRQFKLPANYELPPQNPWPATKRVKITQAG